MKGATWKNPRAGGILPPMLPSTITQSRFRSERRPGVAERFFAGDLRSPLRKLRGETPPHRTPADDSWVRDSLEEMSNFAFSPGREHLAPDACKPHHPVKTPGGAATWGRRAILCGRPQVAPPKTRGRDAPAPIDHIRFLGWGSTQRKGTTWQNPRAGGILPPMLAGNITQSGFRLERRPGGAERFLAGDLRSPLRKLGGGTPPHHTTADHA